MKIFKTKIFLALIFSGLLYFCASCQNSQDSSTILNSTPPSVLVSIPPYRYFVERIAQDSLEIEILAPPGSNPHLFEPTPKQVEKALKSKMWVRIGESFEKKISMVLKEQNPSMIMVDLSTQATLLNAADTSDHHIHHHESRDLHIWLSPKLALQQAEAIAEGLCLLFPEKRTFFKANLEEFLLDLKKIDAELEKELAPFRGEAILASHGAFGYFCRDYNLIQLALESEGKDPLPKDLAATLAQASEKQARCVLIQMQYNNKGAEMIGQKLHLPIFLADPYSSDYLSNLKYIAHCIADQHDSCL